MFGRLWFFPSLLVLLQLTVSEGCELQAIIDSALTCVEIESDSFNLNKYTAFIENLVESSSANQSVEDFLHENTFSYMVRAVGEVEPAIVWLLDSFYEDNFKDRVNDDWIKPMFGDMSNMGTVLEGALDLHCKIVNELLSCFNTELASRCKKEADATRVMEDFLYPIQKRYCAGATFKSSAVEWFGDHSDKLTTAFSCVTKDPESTKFEFIDFEEKFSSLNIDFDKLLQKCNAFAFGEAEIQKFYFEELEDLFDFENFNMTTFNIMDVLDADIPPKFFRIARPMADCLVIEFKKLGQQFCPNLEIDAELNKLLDVMKFMFPLFLEEQETIGELALNPEKLDLPSADRYSLAVVGDSHVYNSKTDEWKHSCSELLDRTMILAAHRFQIYKVANGDMIISTYFLSIIQIHLEFKADSNVVSKIFEIGETQTKVNGTFDDLPQFLKDLSLAKPQGIILNKGDDWFTMHLVANGMLIKISNPTGKNWVMYVRASEAAFKLSYGFVDRGCKTSDAIMDAISATDASSKCVIECAATAAMMDTCEYDCENNFGGEMISEMVDFTESNLMAARLDKKVRNAVINLDGGTYAPCSIIGFFQNVASPCARKSIISKTFPGFEADSLAEFISTVGVAEPYAYYAVMSFYQKWILDTGKMLPYEELTTLEIENFVNMEKLDAIFKAHCVFVAEFGQCLMDEVEVFCPSISDILIHDYVKPLQSRYCSADVTTDSSEVKEDVVEDIVADFEELTAPLECFIDLTVTDTLEFNTELAEQFFQLISDRCNVENLLFYANRLAETSSVEDDILEVVDKFIKIARNPGRCILQTLGNLCPNTNFKEEMTKLMKHITRATAGVFPMLDMEYFYPTEKIDFGSRDRVTLWAVGDPHVKHLDAKQFSVCDSPGDTTFFSSEAGTRVVLQGTNTPVSVSTNATIISELKLMIYAPGVGFDADPAVTYEAKDGKLPDTFKQGTQEIVILNGESDFSVTLRIDDKLGVAFITNADTGTMIAIAPFKNFYNIVMRSSRSYVETGSGLLVEGCLGAEKSAEDLPERIANARRRKRATAPTEAECEDACSAVKGDLNKSCFYDCYTMEDTSVGEAHVKTVAVEEEVIVEDEKIQKWFPDDNMVDPDSSANCVAVSLTILVVAALAFFK